jgi:hypothetical protein
MEHVPFYPSSVTTDAVNTDMCTPASNYLPTDIPVSHSVELAALSPVFFGDLFDFLPMPHPQQPEYGLVTPAELESSRPSSSLKQYTSSSGPQSPNVENRRKNKEEMEKICKDRNKSSAAAYRKRRRGTFSQSTVLLTCN